MVDELELTKALPEYANDKTVTRSQIKLIFQKLTSEQWRGHFTRENSNGLGAARIGGKDDARYSLQGVCQWLEGKAYYTPAEIQTEWRNYSELSEEQAKPKRKTAKKRHGFEQFMPK